MAGDWKFYVSNAIILLASSDTLRTKAGEITGKVWEAMKSSRLFRRKERQPEEQSVSSQDTFQTARDTAPSRTSRVFCVASSFQNFETAAKVILPLIIRRRVTIKNRILPESLIHSPISSPRRCRQTGSFTFLM